MENREPKSSNDCHNNSNNSNDNCKGRLHAATFSDHGRKSVRRRIGARNKRGIGAILGGTILALILFTSVFIYFITIMQTQSEKGRADVQAARVDESKRLETFKIRAYQNTINNSTGYELIPVMLDNTGPLPINATFAVVTRLDDPTDRLEIPLEQYGNENIASSPPNVQVINQGDSALFFVGSTQPSLAAGKTYHIDVISERGNVVGTQWPPASPTVTLSAAQSLIVQRGFSAQSTISVASEEGFTGSVFLAVTGQPAGVTLTLNTNPVFVPDSGTATTDLLITATPTATLGTFPLNVTATSGSIQKSTTINLTVVDSGSGSSQPDFSISVNPNPLVVQPGQSGSTQVVVTSLNGFSSAISLAISGSYPGITVQGPNPNSVTPPAQGSQSSSLTFIVDSSVIPGTFVYSVTGTNGSITHTAQLSLTVLTSGSGERNTGENIGTGPNAIYNGMDGTKLQFKTLQAGGGITITGNSTDTLVINATGGSGGGEANDGKSLGCDPVYNSQAQNPPAIPNCANVYAGKSGTLIQFY